MQQKDDRGRYKMFSFSYVRLNESREGNGSPGSIEDYEVAYFSSILPRKFIRCMIIRINGKKIYA